MLAISFRGDMIEIVKTLISRGAYFNADHPEYRMCFVKTVAHDNIRIFDFLVKNNKVNIFIGTNKRG